MSDLNQNLSFLLKKSNSVVLIFNAQNLFLLLKANVIIFLSITPPQYKSLFALNFSKFYSSEYSRLKTILLDSHFFPREKNIRSKASLSAPFFQT